MTVVLIRHAARELQNPGGGISLLGKSQAEGLAKKIVGSTWLTAPVVLETSPKRRAMETAEIIGRAVGLSFKILPELDEASGNENMGAFTQRIANYFMEMPLRTAGTVLCVSHSDWLEEAAYYLFKGRPALQWSNAAAYVIDFSSRGAKLVTQC